VFAGHETHRRGGGQVGEQIISVYGAAVLSSHPLTCAACGVALRDGDEETVMGEVEICLI
jgi:hypothetical protein